MNYLTTRIQCRVLSLIWALVCMVPAPLLASTDALIEGAKQCTRFLPSYERSYGIPVHLLAAIASTESGRWHKGLNIALPWPWTINVDGKGYYYDSKEQAIAAAKQFKMAGAHNIDVGCMQVSMLHHGTAFRSLDEAFEPQTNIAYAAEFLHGLYEEQKDWRSAAAAYHSKTPSLGAEYMTRVFSQWTTILDRVRSARKQPDTALASASATATSAPKQYATLRPASFGTSNTRYKSPSTKIITVRDARVPSASNDVLIIRPQLSQAMPAPQTSVASIPAGPRFIFND